MQGCLTKLRILFHCLLDGGQFSLSRSRNGPQQQLQPALLPDKKGGQRLLQGGAALGKFDFHAHAAHAKAVGIVQILSSWSRFAACFILLIYTGDRSSRAASPRRESPCSIRFWRTKEPNV